MGFENASAGFDGSLIVDSDVHPSYHTPEARERLADYMDEPYSSIIHPDSPDDPYPSFGWPKTMGGNRSGVMHEELYTHRDVDEKLLSNGIDYAILNFISLIDTVRGTERSLQEMRAANDVLLEYYLDDGDGQFGLCTVTTKDVPKAVEELERMGAEDAIVGVVFFPGSEYQKPLGDPSYDPIYAAAEDNDLTVVYHAVDDTICSRDAPVLLEFEQFVSMHTLGFPWTAMLTLTSLIVQGTPVKFPELNFVILESGVGWIPYMMGRLNREVDWRRSEAPLLEESPEEYIRDSFYFGTQPLEELNDPTHMEQILDVVGAENLLFATDYPHWDFDTPEAIGNQLRRTFSAEERDRILHRNAIEAFGLDV